MASEWDVGTAGLLRLPSGRAVRGRSLRGGVPPGPLPDFGLYLTAKQPETCSWPSRWLPWPDFRTPRDHDAAREALMEAWGRASGERVEVACDGGRGRTGTALACLAVIDGVPAGEAVAYVRRGYHPRAVETPWQRRYVARFDGPLRPRQDSNL